MPASREELVRQIADATDLDPLSRLLAPIVGELCWGVVFSYGDELRVDCGERIPYRHPKLAGKARGAWTIGARASPWELTRDDDRVASTSDDSDTMRERVGVLAGLRVEACEARFPDLQLAVSFSEGLVLRIGPEGPAGRPPPPGPLAYWEVFTPNRMVLSAGPGPKWSYLRADEPMK